MEGITMKVVWLVTHPTAPQNLAQMKDIGPIWGTWETWRVFRTDNVVCADAIKIRDLLSRAFQTVCNFYMPAGLVSEMQRPLGVQTFLPISTSSSSLVNLVNLVAREADIVLIPQWTELTPVERTEISKIIKTSSAQWIELDVETPLFAHANYLLDTTENVVKMLSG